MTDPSPQAQADPLLEGAQADYEPVKTWGLTNSPSQGAASCE